MPLNKLNSASQSSAIEMLSAQDIFRLLTIAISPAQAPNYAHLINLLVTAVFIRNKTRDELSNQLAYLDHLNAERWTSFYPILENQLVKTSLKFAFESEIATPEYIYTLLYTWYLRDLSFETNANSQPDLLASLNSQTDLELNLVTFSLLPNIVIRSQDISKFIDLFLCLLTYDDDLIRSATVGALQSLAGKIPQDDTLRVIDGLFATLQDRNYEICKAAKEALPKIFEHIQHDLEFFIQYLLLKFAIKHHFTQSCAADCLEKIFSKFQHNTQVLPESLCSILNNRNTPKSAVTMLKTVALKLKPQSLQQLFESVLSAELEYCWRQIPQSIMSFVCANSDFDPQDIEKLKMVIVSKLDNNAYGSVAALSSLSELSSKFDSRDLQDFKEILLRKVKDTNSHVREAAIAALSKLYLTAIPQQAQELTFHLQPMYADPMSSVSESIVSALESLCFQLEITEVDAPIQGLLLMSAHSAKSVAVKSAQALLNVLALYPEQLYTVLEIRFPEMLPVLWTETGDIVTRLNILFFSESLLNLLLSVIAHPDSVKRQAAARFLSKFLEKIQNIDPNTQYDVSLLPDACKAYQSETIQKLIIASSAVINRVRYQPDLFNILLAKLDTSPLSELPDVISALLALSKTAMPNDVRRFIESLLCIIARTQYNPSQDIRNGSYYGLQNAISAFSVLPLEPQDATTLFELSLTILKTPDPTYLMYGSILTVLSDLSERLDSEDAQKLFETLLPLFSTREITRFVRPLLMLSPRFEVKSRQTLINACVIAVSEDSVRVIMDILPSLSEHIEQELVYALLTPVIAWLNDSNSYRREDALEFLCHWIVSHEIEHELINIPTKHREAILFLAIYALKIKITFQSYLLKSSIPILKQEYLGDAPYITQTEINAILDNPGVAKHQRIIAGFYSFFQISAGDADAPQKARQCLDRYTL